MHTKIPNPIDPADHHVWEAIWVSENNNNDDIACDVCLSKSDEIEDRILICDGCNSAVH